jgi:tetratricopeptide (TPR) repeat protein
LQNQLRDKDGDFLWNAWDEAANYLLANKLNLDRALRYANRSIQMEERFENLTTKAGILYAMGQTKEAEATRDLAISGATPVQLHIYGRRLQFRRNQEQAFAIFRINIKKHPAHWTAHQDAARLACAEGDFDTAVREMRLALIGAPEFSRPSIEALVRQLEAKRNINEE